MIDDLYYAQRLLSGVRPLLVLATQIDDHPVGTNAADNRREAKVSGHVRHSASAEVFSSYSPHEAVGGAQHPLAVDEGASTVVGPIDMHTGLPGPPALGGDLSSNDPAVDLRSTTHWGDTELDEILQSHSNLLFSGKSDGAVVLPSS